MALSAGFVGLPNAGPEQSLPHRVLYVYASEGRLYGARLGVFLRKSLSEGGVLCH